MSRIQAVKNGFMTQIGPPRLQKLAYIETVS